MQAASSSPPKITVIIPTLNEARNLPHVLPRLPLGLHEVIVVDGNSVDGTLEVARRLQPDARIIVQDRYGKRNALASGLAAATGDIVVMLDVDGSADPSEIPQFVKALIKGADFVKGSRVADSVNGITRVHAVTHRMLSKLVNALCHTQYADPCCGFTAIWRCHVPVLGLSAESGTGNGRTTWLSGNGFEIDALINVRAAQAGLIVKEIANSKCRPIRNAGNLTAMSDSLCILSTLLAERYYSRQRKASTLVTLMVLLRANPILMSRYHEPAARRRNSGRGVHLPQRSVRSGAR